MSSLQTVDELNNEFESLEVEGMTEACREAYEETSWAFERAIDKAINFGRLLCIAKAKIPHGQWTSWVVATFEDQISLRKIQRYMQISNASDQTLLEGANTIDDAIGRIGVKQMPEELKPREFDQQLLVETTMAIGIGDDISVVVQPNTALGYAHVSILIGEACTYTKRGIRRDHVPMLIDMELPKDSRIKWEFFESADRVSEAMFKCDESLTNVSQQTRTTTDDCMHPPERSCNRCSPGA